MVSKRSLQSSRALLTRITNLSYPTETAPIANNLWQRHLQTNNPLWKHLTVQTFRVNDKSGIAHAMALIDERLPDIGLVGYFGATTPAAGRKVLSGACDWLKTQGLYHVYGPVNGTITADYRFNLADDYQIPGEPVNPPWYIDVFRDVGFDVFNRYVSGIVRHPQLYIRLAMPKHPKRGYEHISLRPFNYKLTKHDIATYHKLMNTIFPANSIYCPVITLAERTYNLISAGTTFDPSYSFVAYDNKEPVGFIVAYPHQDSLVIKTIGVLPSYRGKRISNLLVRRVHDQASRDGLKTAIYSTIRESTKVYKMKRPGLVIHRRYVTLHRSL